MNIFKFNLKLILQILFVIIFFLPLQAKNLDKFNAGNYISDYFSGILLLNDNKYNESYNFLKKLNGLEESHLDYSLIGRGFRNFNRGEFHLNSTSENDPTEILLGP